MRPELVHAAKGMWPQVVQTTSGHRPPESSDLCVLITSLRMYTFTLVFSAVHFLTNIFLLGAQRPLT